MKRLHLVRHAKSSWADASLSDHERPLTRRGERAASLLAEWLAAHDVRPELVLCSTATRAGDTYARVAASVGEPPALFEDGLYHASVAALLARLRLLRDDIEEALLVGHNPGLQELCLLLAAPSTDRERVAAKLPTGALVTLELEADRWAAVSPGRARIDAVVFPREL